MTRATTPHPAHGGAHTDDLEKGPPHDVKSEAAGKAVDVTNDDRGTSPNELERGNYPEPGTNTSGGGAHNHRSLPSPSAVGGRGEVRAKGFAGEGRASRTEACGVMGSTEDRAPKGKGYMGG